MTHFMLCFVISALGCRRRGLLDFYSISYLYFGALSTGASVLVGAVVSYVTGETDTPISK